MRAEANRKPTTGLLSILASNVRRLRADQGLSQEGLADRAKLHRTYVGAVERGERNVSLSTLEAFANALSVSVPSLLTEEGGQ